MINISVESGSRSKTKHVNQGPALCGSVVCVPEPPLSPWNDRCAAKKNILASLKDPHDPIHLWSAEKVHKTYASGYKYKNFQQNYKRMLKSLGIDPMNNKKKKQKSSDDGKTEGIQNDTSNEPEKWNTRSKKSKGYKLLYKLFMDQSKSGIDQKTTEEIWKSHRRFSCYPLKDFKKYVDKMKKMTDKRRVLLEEQERDFEHHCLHYPRKAMTNRGYPFWDTHPASTLLVEHVKSGFADKYKPKELWMLSEHYKDFPLGVFRGHMYQEKYKQLAAPYWKVKRNKIALKMHDDEVENMKQDWMNAMQEN